MLRCKLHAGLPSMGAGGALEVAQRAASRRSTHRDICFSSQCYRGLAGSVTQAVLTLRPCTQVFPHQLARWVDTHTYPPSHHHSVIHRSQCSARLTVTSTPVPSKTELGKSQRHSCTHGQHPHHPFWRWEALDIHLFK